MKTCALKFSGLVLGVLLIFPASASAFQSVDSTVYRVSDTAYVLTYTYTAGFLNSDALFPIAASLEYGEGDQYPRVGFALVGSDEVLQVSAVNALVLSDASIVDNQYQTTAGERNTFTLLTVVTLKEPRVASDMMLALRWLPFEYTKDGQAKSGAYEVE